MEKPLGHPPTFVLHLLPFRAVAFLKLITTEIIGYPRDGAQSKPLL